MHSLANVASDDSPSAPVPERYMDEDEDEPSQTEVLKKVILVNSETEEETE